jgi:hypothetical protein
MLPTSAQLAQTMSPVASSPAGWQPGSVASSSVDRLLDRMAPTTLAQLDSVSLLDRVDTKFLLTVPRLIEILPRLAQEYLVLDIQGRRRHQYRTLYFDTPGLDLYHLHQASRPVRHKVRSRSYVDTGLSFFEIKAKTLDNRTVKHRLATSTFVTDWTTEASTFVASHLGAAAQLLQPTLSNDFFRVTLIDKRCTERVTLDLSIQFNCDGRTAVFPGIVIAELKQGKVDQRSVFADQMRAAEILPTSISKYCAGVGLLVSKVEHEASAKMLAAVERLTRGQSDVPFAAIADRVASRS